MPVAVANGGAGWRLVNNRFNSGAVVDRKLDSAVQDLERQELEHSDREKDGVFGPRLDLHLEAERHSHLKRK